LWKDKVYFRFADVADEELLRIIDARKDDPAIARLNPHFLIVRNREPGFCRGTSAWGTTLDVAADGLAANFNFFLPWAGIEKTGSEPQLRRHQGGGR